MIDLPPPDPGIEISIASRGMSKGTAQTDGPQVVVRPQLSLGSAFLAAYAKNVSSPDSGLETGAVAGVRHRFATIDWTASVTLKTLAGVAAGIDDEAVEVAIGGARKLGSLNTQLTVYLSPDELGSTGRSFYGEAQGTLPVVGGLNVVASLGLRRRENGPDYTAASAGISQTLVPGVRAELRYYDTSKSDLGDAYKGRFVAALRASF